MVETWPCQYYHSRNIIALRVSCSNGSHTYKGDPRVVIHRNIPRPCVYLESWRWGYKYRCHGSYLVCSTAIIQHYRSEPYWCIVSQYCTACSCVLFVHTED